MLADSRERIGLFNNVCVKPNEEEYNRSKLSRNTWSRYTGVMFTTMGNKGTVVVPFKEKRPELYTDVVASGVPAYPVSGPIDIVGAGDSCSAGIAAAMVAGLTHEQAAAFGNLVASITIRQLGVTGTASPEQVRARWREVQ